MPDLPTCPPPDRGDSVPVKLVQLVLIVMAIACLLADLSAGQPLYVVIRALGYAMVLCAIAILYSLAQTRGLLARQPAQIADAIRGAAIAGRAAPTAPRVTNGGPARAVRQPAGKGGE